jgi:hypothetical protein
VHRATLQPSSDDSGISMAGAVELKPDQGRWGGGESLSSALHFNASAKAAGPLQVHSVDEIPGTPMDYTRVVARFDL